MEQALGGGGGVGQVLVGDKQFLGGGDVHAERLGEAHTDRFEGDGQYDLATGVVVPERWGVATRAGGFGGRGGTTSG